VQTEHSAVLQSCATLERRGWTITRLPVRPDGVVEPETVEAALTDETVLVAVMWANNETGVVQPIEEISTRVRTRGILFLTDATQAVGKIAVDVEQVDLLACTAHKVYGPKGVGALYVRKNPRVKLVPLLDGGAQEEGLRSGTLNTPGIVGMGAAVAFAAAGMEAEAVRLGGLRDEFERVLMAATGVRINGAGASRLPHVSNIVFPGVRSARLVTELRELAMSTGSACSTGTGSPSHVLKAMGLSDDEAYATLRISLGRFTTAEEVRFAASRIAAVVGHLQNSSPVTI
jgi:cysteine desulfurase